METGYIGQRALTCSSCSSIVGSVRWEAKEDKTEQKDWGNMNQRILLSSWVNW